MIRILNSVADRLISRYRTTPVYIQRIPAGFVRPSFFIQFVAGDIEELNRYKRRWNLNVQVVFFSGRTDNEVVDVDKQMGELNKIYSLFIDGSLPVYGTDRFAKVTGINGYVQDEEIYFDLQMYIDDFDELKEPDDYDIAQDADIEIKNVEE